jgi:glycosyltransferase involved in cell wall biosynthesis
MKIALITNNYEPIISGITTSVNTLIESLEERGHEIFVVAPKYPRFADERDNIYRTPSLRIYFRENYPLPFVTPRRLAKILRKKSIDLIHSQHPFGLGKTALTIAKSYLDLPIVFTYHTMYEHYSHYLPLPNSHYLKAFIKHAAIKYANQSDLVISPTTAFKKLLIESGCKTQIRVVPSGNSSNIRRSYTSIDLENIRKMLGFCGKTPVLLCVGRVASEKNCVFLLKALKIVLSRLPDAKLLIVGDGHSLGELKRATESLRLLDSVVFVGAIPHHEVAKFYSIATILLFSSQTETQGLPLTEALHFGLPIVAVESLASKELVEKLGTGMVTRANAEDFAEAVIVLCSDFRLLSVYRQRNYKLSNIYTGKKQAEKLEWIYHTTLALRSASKERFCYGRRFSKSYSE